jgi:hypothetical protein
VAGAAGEDEEEVPLTLKAWPGALTGVREFTEPSEEGAGLLADAAGASRQAGEAMTEGRA